jgi:hypothetical protein
MQLTRFSRPCVGVLVSSVKIGCAQPTGRRCEATIDLYSTFRRQGRRCHWCGAGHRRGRRAPNGRLALVDRSPLVEDVQREAEAAGAEAIAIFADLETYAGATAAMRGARERYGGVDIVVNNVGGTIWAKPYAEYAEAQIEAEIRRSLFPTLWCCRAALPAMLGPRRWSHHQRLFHRDAQCQPRALRGGEGRGHHDHRVSSHGIRGARHPRLRGGTRWHRSPTAAHPRATPQSRAPRRKNGPVRSWTGRSRRA